MKAIERKIYDNKIVNEKLETETFNAGFDHVSAIKEKAYPLFIEKEIKGHKCEFGVLFQKENMNFLAGAIVVGEWEFVTNNVSQFADFVSKYGIEYVPTFLVGVLENINRNSNE